MGAIWFNPTQLADNLHEVVGYKAGLAVSIPQMCDLLVGTRYPDTILSSEEGAIRLRAEEYEDLYYELLHKVGHTAERSHGHLDLASAAMRIRKKHGDEFANDLMGLYIAGTKKMVEQAVAQGSKLMNPEELLLTALERCGKNGFEAVMELLEIQNRVISLNPHTGTRWIEWKNIESLAALYETSSRRPEHGQFFDQRFIDFLSANREQLDKMHWRKFEELTAEFFHKQGHKVELGPGTNDDGVDMRVWVPDSEAGKSHLHIVQCKRQKAKVEKVVVKGLYADVQHEGAALGVLVTTSELSPGAKATIRGRGYPIKEVDGKKIVEWLKILRTPGTGIMRV